MSIQWNPMNHVLHAWEKTHSSWGKISIVTFYSFVWINVVWALALVVNPWIGYECAASHAPDAETFVATTLFRGQNMFALGFFLYAERGGIKVGNVAMAFIVHALVCCTIFTLADHYSAMDVNVDCVDGFDSLRVTMWVLIGLSGLALVTAILDAAHATASSSEERTPLV
ncbi:hypothetical protein ACA910_013829 [Epithemia clementina (nom. ined.)]